MHGSQSQCMAEASDRFAHLAYVLTLEGALVNPAGPRLCLLLEVGWDAHLARLLLEDALVRLRPRMRTGVLS